MRTLQSFRISDTKNAEHEREKDVPATPEETNKRPWFSSKNGDEKRKKSAVAQTSERATPPHGKRRALEKGIGVFIAVHPSEIRDPSGLPGLLKSPFSRSLPA
jgi:hypothetical protein